MTNKVWIVIVIAALAVVLYLKIPQNGKKEKKKKRFGNNRESVVLYVVGNLVSQGIPTEISYKNKYSNKEDI